MVLTSSYGTMTLYWKRGSAVKRTSQRQIRQPHKYLNQCLVCEDFVPTYTTSKPGPVISLLNRQQADGQKYSTCVFLL